MTEVSSEFIFSAILLFNAIFYIPQCMRIINNKSVQDISCITFLGLLSSYIAALGYGVLIQSALLMVAAASCVLLSSIIIILSIKFRNSITKLISFEEIFSQLPTHVYCKDNNFVLTESNTNNWKDFGAKSLDDFLGKTDYDFFPKEEADLVRAVDEEVLATGKLRVVEEWLTTTDGSKALYLSYKQPLRDKHNKIIGLLGCSIDITASKQKVLDELSVLDNVIAVMPGNVYWMDHNGVYLGCNDNEAKAVGLNSRKDIVGKRNRDIEGFVISEVIDAVNERVLSNGETVTIEEPVVFDDRKRGVFLSTKAPIFDSRGQIAGLVGISVDITDKKEVEKLNAQLKVEKERNKVLKLLAGSISHELRTPLSTIFLGLKSALEDATKLQDYIQNQLPTECAESSQPLNQLAKQLVDSPNQLIDVISNCQKVIDMQLKNIAIDEAKVESDTPYQIRDVMEKAISLYPYKKHQKALINTDFSVCDDFTFIGNDQQMMHVFWNLIKNALYYVEAAGKGEIFIRLETTDEFNICQFKDTGTGMPEEIRKNVFKQFFTRRTNGTGLGLSFCDLVMQSCGGKIVCNAKEGEYTQFSLLFPKK